MHSLLSSIKIHDHTGDQYSPSLTSGISQYPIGTWHLEQPKKSPSWDNKHCCSLKKEF